MGAAHDETVFRRSLPRWIDPAVVFATLYADERNAFWLDAGVHAANGMSHMGASDRVVTESVLDTIRAEARVVPAAAGTALGWVGWFGYGLGLQLSGVDASVRSRHPDAAALHVTSCVSFDHTARTIELVSLDEHDLDRLQRALEHLVHPEPWLAPRAAAAVWRESDDEYLRSIEACREAIHDGEAYLLCLTTSVSVDVHPDPVAAYLALRGSNSVSTGGFVRVGDVALLSASPETFLRVGADGAVETRPIKGTRPRDADPARDTRLAVELRADEKERAENLMIVDLMRNDLGRVCATGSIEVPELFVVETHSHVHQLVSAVRGRLAPGRTAVDALEVCLPAGSMTGAPKRRAIELLDGLEHRARGLYAGAFGCLGLDGRADLSMIIRSIVLDERGATIGTGGGITALSDPAAELAEMQLKARALLAVLGAD